MRNSSGPYSSQRPDSSHRSAGCTTGIRTSMAPDLFISSRTMLATLFSTRRPVGSQVYIPAASLRIIPARSISWWLMTSASAGVSFCVDNKYWLVRIGSVYLFLIIKPAYSSSVTGAYKACCPRSVFFPTHFF